ncbi:MAG: metallophosphoesterase [Polyangiales bacterium]
MKAFLNLIFGLLCAALFLGCADSQPDPTRVVLITDTHVIGPQYTEPHETPGVDNVSIFKTPERLARVIESINALRPAPKMVFVLGDVVHDAYHSHDFDWYLQNDSAFSVARELFSELKVPVRFLFGNHDYEVNCEGDGSDSYSRELTARLFSEFFGANEYDAVQIGAWRFLLLNGQLGATWEYGNASCGGSGPPIASFGAEQLAWVDTQLSDGKPSILLSHYIEPLLWSGGEFPDGPNRDLAQVLTRYDNDRALFAGHMHRWLDVPSESVGEQHVLAATRYDTDNFWLLELDEDGESFEILDYEKRINLSTCAKTYSYDSDPPMLNPDAEEMGDCVVGF